LDRHGHTHTARASVPTPIRRVAIWTLCTRYPSVVSDCRTQSSPVATAPFPFFFLLCASCHLLARASQFICHHIPQKFKNTFVSSAFNTQSYKQICLITNLMMNGSQQSADLDLATLMVATCQSPTITSRGHFQFARNCTIKCHLKCSLLSVSSLPKSILTCRLTYDSTTSQATTRSLSCSTYPSATRE
jgi:hypothetical protein